MDAAGDILHHERRQVGRRFGDVTQDGFDCLSGGHVAHCTARQRALRRDVASPYVDSPASSCSASCAFSLM